MAILIGELAAMFFGIFVLFKGKTTFMNRAVEGTPAKIVAATMILPFPLTLLAWVILGIILAAQGKEVNPQSLQPAADIVMWGILLLCFFTALGIGLTTGKRLDGSRASGKKLEKN